MSKEMPVFKLEDLKQHTTDKSCWLAVNGKVYDVTEFLEEHPGGYDIILTSTGKDATQDFEEIGHSNSAKDLLEKYIIGTYEGGAPPPTETRKITISHAPKTMSSTTRIVNVMLPLVLLAAAVAVNYYLSNKKVTTA